MSLGVPVVPKTDTIDLESLVRYIVVTGMHWVRYSHSIILLLEDSCAFCMLKEPVPWFCGGGIQYFIAPMWLPEWRVDGPGS